MTKIDESPQQVGERKESSRCICTQQEQTAQERTTTTPNPNYSNKPAMTASTHFIEVVRRIPKQDRAERRIQEILQSADRLIGEKGITRTTMTEIAQVSGTSIGAIYQYFPNKETLVAALRARCLKELEVLLKPMASKEADPDTTELADVLANLLVTFSARYPAYRHLFFSTEPEFRNDADDKRLLKRFQKLFSSYCRTLSDAQVGTITETAVIIIKGLLDVGIRVPWERHGQLLDEIKFALASYLRSRCRPRMKAPG